MNDEVQQLHAELDAITEELAAAQSTLQRLTRRSPRLVLLVLVVIAACAVTSWTLFAQAGSGKTGKVTSITGPFEVVDHKGISILRVDGKQRRVDLYNKAGKRMARLDSVANGSVTAEDPDNSETASELTAVLHPRFVIWNKGIKRVALGRTLEGGGRVDVFSPRRPESLAGMRTFAGGLGQIAVYNVGGFAVSHLAESDKVKGAGRITVANLRGEGVFSAGGIVSGGEFCRGRGRALECGGLDLPLSIRVSPK